MEEEFKIFIDRLCDGEEEVIEETYAPEAFNINEKDQIFSSPVNVQGRALKSKGTLLLQFSLQAEVTIPCAICTQPTPVAIQISNFIHSEELSNIRSGIFHFKELLRETLLLEVPYTTECHGGYCPERKTVAEYFKKKQTSGDEGESTHQPFADLDLK